MSQNIGEVQHEQNKSVKDIKSMFESKKGQDTSNQNSGGHKKKGRKRNTTLKGDNAWIKNKAQNEEPANEEQIPEPVIETIPVEKPKPQPEETSENVVREEIDVKSAIQKFEKIAKEKTEKQKPIKELDQKKQKREETEEKPVENEPVPEVKNLEPEINEPIVIIQEPIKVKDVVTKINEGNRFDLLPPTTKPESNPLPFSEEGREIQSSITQEEETKPQLENITIEPKETPEKTLELLEPDEAQPQENLLDYTPNPIEENPRASPIKESPIKQSPIQESPTKQSPKKESQTYQSPQKYAQFVDEEDQPKYSPSKNIEKKGNAFEMTGITLNPLEKQPKDETPTNSTQASFQQTLSKPRKYNLKLGDEMDKPLLEESKFRSDQDLEVHHRKNWTKLDVMDRESPTKRSKNCMESLCEKISKMFG